MDQRHSHKPSGHAFPRLLYYSGGRKPEYCSRLQLDKHLHTQSSRWDVCPRSWPWAAMLSASVRTLWPSDSVSVQLHPLHHHQHWLRSFPRHYRIVNPADSLRDKWICRANSWWSFNRRYVPTQRPRKSSGTLRTWTHSRASHWALSRGFCRQWNAKLEVAYVGHGYFVWIQGRILCLILAGNIRALLAATESGKISEN